MNRPVLPDSLRGHLSALGEGLARGRVHDAGLTAILDEFNRVPPADVARAAREIADLAQLHHDRAKPFPLPQWFQARSDRDMLSSLPGLAHVFLFHEDGHLREAALNALEVGAPSPFAFAAIAFRLNDWAGEVRAAAAACAARVFPRTEAGIIVPAALILLERRRSWRRWREEAALLDEVLARPDVVERLAETLLSARSGAMGRVLRHALTQPSMDHRLLDLATGAVQPSIRAIALRCLIEGKTSWPVGSTTEWIDKVYGVSRSVPIMTERDVPRPLPVGDLIESGLRDPSALVRKVAADGVIRFRDSLPDAGALARRLAFDRSAAVRERAAFVLQELARP